MTGFTDNAKTWDVCGIKLTLKWFTWTANIIAEPPDWLCYELHVWRIVVRFSTWVRNSALLQIVQANLGAHLAYNSMDDKRTFSPGLLRLQRKADHPSQPTADVTNAWSYTFTLPPRLHNMNKGNLHQYNSSRPLLNRFLYRPIQWL